MKAYTMVMEELFKVVRVMDKEPIDDQKIIAAHSKCILTCLIYLAEKIDKINKKNK